jgi:hypothetical protein
MHLFHGVSIHLSENDTLENKNPINTDEEYYQGGPAKQWKSG